jgi:hypothetical protein
VIQFIRAGLFLCVAGSLAAQTLSFGEITLVTPATTPPTYNVNVVMAGSGGVVAGLQFDLNYDPTSLNVTIAPGASATAASLQLSTICLGQAIGSCTTPAANNPFCVNTGSCVAPQDTKSGWRAILIGCCGGSQTTPTSNIVQDGVVATLTVQATATPNSQLLTLMPSPYMVGTTQGGLNTAAQTVNFSIGAGSSDAGATGTLNLYPTYLVGGISPMTATGAPNFGSGKIQLNDLILELLYQTGAPGYTLPAACTDYFDALDTYPADTATTRGGDGVINLNDLVLELLRQTGAPGYGTLPVRTARGESCASVTQAQLARVHPEVRGSLALGPTEGTGTAQERTPVYLNAGRDLSKAAVAFSAGDEQSQLNFQAASGMSPSLMYNSQPGFVSVAFLAGFDARGGDRILLGYIVGPSGSGARMKIFGTSATGLSDGQTFSVDFAGVVRQ